MRCGTGKRIGWVDARSSPALHARTGLVSRGSVPARTKLWELWPGSTGLRCTAWQGFLHDRWVWYTGPVWLWERVPCRWGWWANRRGRCTAPTEQCTVQPPYWLRGRITVQSARQWGPVLTPPPPPVPPPQYSNGGVAVLPRLKPNSVLNFSYHQGQRNKCIRAVRRCKVWFGTLVSPSTFHWSVRGKVMWSSSNQILQVLPDLDPTLLIFPRNTHKVFNCTWAFGNDNYFG